MLHSTTTTQTSLKADSLTTTLVAVVLANEFYYLLYQTMTLQKKVKSAQAGSETLDREARTTQRH